MMKIKKLPRLFTISTVLALASQTSFSYAQSYERRATPIFYYSHMISSPYTLPSGTLAYGTQISYGLTDFFQISTNLVRDIYQIYNLSVKVALLDFPNFALAATMSWENYNYKDISTLNPNIDVTSWMPGLVSAFALSDTVAWFLGGNLNVSEITVQSNSIESSGLLKGATIQSDLSWAYNPHKNSIGNVLAVGASYDITYKIYGIGFSHHWPGFQIGLHYYPNADERKVLPILVGGGSIQL